MERFGLIGYPLGHSFSASYFTRKFEAEHLDCRYDLYPIEDKVKIGQFIAQYGDVRGFNVTIPYKEQIMAHLDRLSTDARAIRAVNVVKRIHKPDGTATLEGFNTDWQAFAETLRPLLRGDERNALILGTGGAAKAAAYGLRQLGIKPTFVSRHPEQVTSRSVDKDEKPVPVVPYDALTEDMMQSHLVIVNATPVGMYPHVEDKPDIPYELLSAKHICYDMIYNPEKTRFLDLAASHGATTKNGMEMLIRQAELSWLIWNKADL